MGFPLEVKTKYTPTMRAAEILDLMQQAGWPCLIEELKIQAMERYWSIACKDSEDFSSEELRGTAEGLLKIDTPEFKNRLKRILEGEKNA